VGFCLLRLAAAASFVLVSAASNSTAHKVSITVDERRCRFTGASSTHQASGRLNYKFHSSSTTKQIDVGLFNLGGFHLADDEMPDKANLPEVLRVLDVLLRRLSDVERLPLALVKLVRQCISPAEDADGAQQSAAEACASSFAEIAIAVQRAPRFSVRSPYY